MVPVNHSLPQIWMQQKYLSPFSLRRFTPQVKIRVNKWVTFVSIGSSSTCIFLRNSFFCVCTIGIHIYTFPFDPFEWQVKSFFCFYSLRSAKWVFKLYSLFWNCKEEITRENVLKRIARGNLICNKNFFWVCDI